MYILLPESLTTVDVSYLETYGNRIERLYIQDEQVDAVDFSLLDSMLDTDSPMFYVVYSDDAFRLGKKVTNYVYMDMDKLSTLTSVHNGEHLELVDSRERLQQRMQTMAKELLLQEWYLFPPHC